MCSSDLPRADDPAPQAAVALRPGHAAVSLWLNSGVPATEVARGAGHGITALLKIYAHRVDGRADAANQRITDALVTQDTEPEPGDKEDSDTEQAS